MCARDGWQKQKCTGQKGSDDLEEPQNEEAWTKNMPDMIHTSIFSCDTAP